MLTIEEDLVLNESEVKRNIDLQVSNNQNIEFIIYPFSSIIEDLIKYTLKCILLKFDKVMIANTVYNIMFESILNGLKANAKKLFFIEKSLNILNTEEYKTGIIAFKKHINKTNLRKYGELNKVKGVFVKVHFNFNDGGMQVEIVNNTMLLPSEEIRIREKLAMGEKYDSLMNYYIDNADASEGEGLGLVLSLILLKAEKLDPSLYRIGTKDGITFARIEIPFNNNFISKRHHALEQ